MSGEDLLAILLGVFFFGGGGFMSTLPQNIARWGGITLMVASLCGLCYWFGCFHNPRTAAASDAQVSPHVVATPSPSPAAPLPTLKGSTCTNSVGGNNTAPLSNNCPTIINPVPPHSDAKLYQDGQPVADVSGVTVNRAENTIHIATMWDSDGLDFGRPVAFMNYTCKILNPSFQNRTLIGISPTGQMGANIIPGVTCYISPPY